MILGSAIATWDFVWLVTCEEVLVDTNRRPRQRQGWWTAVYFAAPILLIYLYLFFRWFALADRYDLFLYYHDMGPLVPDTSPFSTVTSSRYWMAGLVASGVVLVFYIAVNWLLGRIRPLYRAPDWWRIWLLVALPLALDIPLITLTVNDPTLPLDLALIISGVTLVGLALALQAGNLAAARPSELIFLAGDSLGMALFLTTLVGLDRMGERPGGDSTAVLLAGFTGAYLLLPLIHHVGFTDGYYYITDADNFLTRDPGLQAALWLAAATLALAFTRLRIWLIGRAD